MASEKKTPHARLEREHLYQHIEETFYPPSPLSTPPNSKHIIWFLLKNYSVHQKKLKNPLKHVPSPICQQVLLLMVNHPTISYRYPVVFFPRNPKQTAGPGPKRNPTVQRSLGFLTTPATAKHAKSGGLAAMAVAIHGDPSSQGSQLLPLNL